MYIYIYIYICSIRLKLVYIDNLRTTEKVLKSEITENI